MSDQSERIAGREAARELMDAIGKAAEPFSQNAKIGFWLELAYFVKINTPEGAELGR